MRSFRPTTVRGELAAAFLTVAFFVATFVGVVTAIHLATIDRAAQLEAGDVGELIADGAAGIEGNRQTLNLQQYVNRLNAMRKRDVVVVDANKTGLAGVDPSDVGRTYHENSRDEVGKTIEDGHNRVFIERNYQNPDGARQIVVAPSHMATDTGKSPIGAVILEYTLIRAQLFDTERNQLFLIIVVGVVVVLAATLFGLRTAKRIGQPLRDLKNSVERIAARDYSARVVVASRDEIGLLGVAFNNMAEEITASHAALIAHGLELEQRVSERTQALSQTNALLQKEVGQRTWEASHDVLTGLVNRREFETMVDLAVSGARHAGKLHVVCYMDLDQFKVVNDTCGHAAGDDLLKELVALMQARIRAADTLARLGGDEFGLLLDGCSLERAQFIAADLLATVGEFRFNWDGKVHTIGVSIGLAAVSGDVGSTAEIMSMADTACYWAKEQGRNRVCVYRTGDSDMATRRRELGWIARINAALAENRFVLYHQSYLPLTEAAGARQHLEVLLRMIDEDGKLVQPGSFLPAAERYNLMPTIDRWVVSTVFARYHGLVAERGGAPLTCAINLSATSLNAEDFLEFIRRQAALHRLPPQSICFEITETAAINNLRQAAEFIRQCKTMGFLFALDDFGTGTSSFGYLKTLPVDYLKIDGGFVKNLERDAVDKAMTETINRIGHIMGIQTIAEYAENDAIIEELKSMGVDYAQGYGVAAPVPLFDPGPTAAVLPRPHRAA